jgi:hypothetical protein
MIRKWTDTRDSTAWHVTTEGAAAQVETGSMVQLIVFRNGETLSTIYEGTRHLDELSDEELCVVLDAARREKLR